MSLEVVGLQKAYRQGQKKIPVLKTIDLKVATGETVAVLGQSGSGKSTFLSLLAGLDAPDSGQIWLGKQNILELGQNRMNRWRGQHIGIVFQQFHLISHLNALENIELPLEILGEPKKRSKEKAMAFLTAVGLGHRHDHLPGQLSGGECQRVAIARALITEPKLLLADEPSGNLDSETGDSVMSVFFQQVREKKITTLLVTHNEELALRCDRKVYLRHGTLSE